MSKIVIDSLMDEDAMMELAGNRSMSEIESAKEFLVMSIRQYFSRLLMNTDEDNRFFCNISVNGHYMYLKFGSNHVMVSSL